MPDVIRLLPDNIANQIAAGEVIQRPASVVKELVENAIDAGSTRIQLIVKDGGRTLVQVIDNGCGMSETDARLCFERHATSKIREAEDLFAIRTMGFRGEALASIAAVSQVEMKTRREDAVMGIRILIEGSTLRNQEPCQAKTGTNVAVRNLFYNVPARRNFLKSSAVEMRHVIDEFQRIALARPDVFFTLHHNGAEIFHLPAGNLRQRIVNIFGNTVNQKLVPVEESTDVLCIRGFIGKPEYFKRNRGEQYFFVNSRFIRSPYLNHAVMSAYEGLLTEDQFPFYVVFLDIEPSRIDINVHPTKQEIKFEDERLVYNYLKVSVKHALGQFNITPSIDFENTQEQLRRRIQPDSSANGASRDSQPHRREEDPNLAHWQMLYQGLPSQPDASGPSPAMTLPSRISREEGSADEENIVPDSAFPREPIQIHGKYLLVPIRSGLLVIDKPAAQEKIFYEQLMRQMEEGHISTQAELFPKMIHMPRADFELMKDLLPYLNSIGFDVQDFGNDTFILHGLPASMQHLKQEPEEIMENLLDQYKQNIDLHAGIKEKLARAMAKSLTRRSASGSDPLELQALIDKLFATQSPQTGLSGQSTFITISLEELEKRFQ